MVSIHVPRFWYGVGFREAVRQWQNRRHRSVANLCRGGDVPCLVARGAPTLYATSEGRVMVVDYTVEGDSFRTLKPRPWTDKQIGMIVGNAPDRVGGRFDLTRDGRRVIAWEPQAQPKEAKVDLQVTMLLNWFDELRRRLPPSGK